jgi:large subunit ribosomal protein L18
MKKDKAFTKRQKKVRGIIKKSSSRVRLSVFRSNRHIYAQVIDDKKNITIVSESDLKKDKKAKGKVKKDSSYSVGENLAKKAVKRGIKKVVFDRSGYKYHGRVKALADGARKGGLDF